MKHIKLFSFLVLSQLFLSGSLFADYKERMKERLPEIISFKDAGSLGEGMDGLLHARGQTTSEIKDLIKNENADRKQFFSETAKRLGGSSQEVAQKFSKALRSKDKPGHWHRDASGTWTQKP
jgi:uncharacterized protein YdbL (DUF1318 family)